MHFMYGKYYWSRMQHLTSVIVISLHTHNFFAAVCKLFVTVHTTILTNAGHIQISHKSKTSDRSHWLWLRYNVLVWNLGSAVHVDDLWPVKSSRFSQSKPPHSSRTLIVSMYQLMLTVIWSCSITRPGQDFKLLVMFLKTLPGQFLCCDIIY